MTSPAQKLAVLLPADRVFTHPDVLERLSKDFYWYSPILYRQLKDKRADLAVAPQTNDEVVAVARFAFEHEIPITLRGAGTGNYGQCVPLYGGILLDLSGLDKILSIDSSEGYVLAEAGVRLGAIETAARAQDWELRCYPSTWVKASVGGFICGGSGGIGSIHYGLLRDNGNVPGLEIITVEEMPRVLWLEGAEVHQALHAYGTTAIVSKVKLALGRKVKWGQLAAVFDSFAGCFDFTEEFAHQALCQKRLVTCFEGSVVSYFAPLKKYFPAGKAAVFLELDEAALLETQACIERRGGAVMLNLPHSPRKGPLLSDYTWNHTTLWAKKADPSITYLQCGFDAEEAREQFSKLKARFGEEFLFHIEFCRSAGNVGPGSLPLIRFTTEQRLQEMIAFCLEIGVGVANPHTYILQEGVGGGWNPAEKKLEAKQTYDPKGLLNPGKFLDFPLPKHLR